MDFADLTKRFCDAACAGGAELAALFTEDGIYHDGFYGDFHGRKAIADMIDAHFHGDAEDLVWPMIEPTCFGDRGYSRYLFGYTSRIPGCEGRRVVFEGMSRFHLRDGLVAHYTEIFDPGIGMAQLGFPPERIGKRARKSGATKWHPSLPVRRWRCHSSAGASRCR